MSRLILTLALLMASGAAQAQLFNPMHCDKLSTFAPSPVNSSEECMRVVNGQEVFYGSGPIVVDTELEFYTYFDTDQRLNNACGWLWTVRYDSSALEPLSYFDNTGQTFPFQPGFQSSVIPFPGGPTTECPECDRELEVTLQRLEDFNPPIGFNANSAEIGVLWRFLGGPGTSAQIWGGTGWMRFFGGDYNTTGSCRQPNPPAEPGAQAANLRTVWIHRVPEPAFAMGIWPAVLVLLMLAGGARAEAPMRMDEAQERFDACEALDDTEDQEQCVDALFDEIEARGLDASVTEPTE